MAAGQLQTRIRSRMVRFLASPAFLGLERRRGAISRRLRGEPLAVHYFHQVDDPYSHLVIQKLDALRDAYDVPFRMHLAPAPAPDFQGSSEHFGPWALRDAQSVADAYGTRLEAVGPPERPAIDAANAALVGVLDQSGFAKRAFEVGEALWAGKDPGGSGSAAAEAALQRGDALRKRLGHYLGGMFYFEGEWFWGIDRIRVLEARLREEGHGRADGGVLVPEPSPTSATGLAAGRVTLEYFPSLRSPYTAVGHARVLDLIARSGVTVQLRPVMPMMMRGVPAPFPKQRYVVVDSAREGRAHGAPFGRIVDPFGEPVKRAFALFPGAVALGRGMEFVTAYLSAAWVDGVDITGDEGLRQVAERAGISWQELQERSRGSDWGALLDQNLDAMLGGAGLWGVPSFRVSGGNASDAFACWGQDRIWRVEDEIARRAR